MTEAREVGSREALAVELQGIRREMARHNQVMRRNRFYLWGLGLTMALLTGLGAAVGIDDQNDDRRECRTDNENSIRDSEVLIEAVEDDLSPEGREIIDRYRENVRANLRSC